MSEQPQPQGQPLPQPPQPPPTTIRITWKWWLLIGAAVVVILASMHSGGPAPEQPIQERPKPIAQAGDPNEVSRFQRDYARGVSAAEMERKMREENDKAEQRNKAALEEAQRMRQAFDDSQHQSSSYGAGNSQVSEADRRRKERHSDSVIIQNVAQTTAPTTARDNVPPTSPASGDFQRWMDENRQALMPPKEEKKEETKPQKVQALDVHPGSTGSYRTMPAGTIVEGSLVNRLNGSALGPVLVQVSNDVRFPGTDIIAFPQGSRFIGKAAAVRDQNDERLAVTFQRVIVPRLGGDYYGVPLENELSGLAQQGDVGLKDKVNHHYFQIFGASLAIGAIGGLAQIGNYQTGFGYDPAVSIRTGISQGMSQAAMQVMSHFLNKLPTVEVRPGTRVRIMFTDDIPFIPIFKERN